MTGLFLETSIKRILDYKRLIVEAQRWGVSVLPCQTLGPELEAPHLQNEGLISQIFPRRNFL